MNQLIFKNRKIYNYTTLEEIQDMNNNIIEKKQKESEQMLKAIDKFIEIVMFVIFTIIGVGFVPIFLTAIAGQ